MWCCKGEFSNCRDTYYRFRPSDDGSRYMPPPPGEITTKMHRECIIFMCLFLACVYGDPHLVTLDLHKYTFNGYGEYVLVETVDNSFTLQGRMVEATTNSALNISSTGTIFSALAAEESHSDTVQLQLDRNADVYLLDDPLSAVDAAVSRHIFDKLAVQLNNSPPCTHCRCIRGLLCNQCVVLVTHQLQYVQQCDTVGQLNLFYKTSNLPD